MPSPITTGGFSVQNMPQVNFADPRLLVPQYSNIIPSIGQGLQAYSQFQDVSQMQPIRQQLAQIQLQQEQAKLAQLPVEQQLQRIKLATASQPIDTVESVGVADVPRLSQIAPEDTPADYVPPTDQMIQSRIKVFNPVTGEVSFENRNTKVEKTAEQIANEKAYADYRMNLGEAAQTRAETVANKLAVGKKLSQGVNPRTGTLVVTILNPDGSTEQLDTGQIPPPSLAQQLGVVLPGIPPQNKQQPLQPNLAQPATTPAVDESTQALIQKLSQAINTGQAPAPNIAQPKSKAEYDALAPGTQYVGQDGQIHIKKG